uniref:E2 ubiquitin-conjugating enzyme n=1 Tax=Strombidinopsis acuminata TaxID=141414 RepID=A0A7S3RXZ5_9SPIT|mmetsp:Transcript_12646/g.38650  ORF Transcript_12646/g.38650 Transcript_12646/m.38650 type:complete len:172 (-) Transcript_12646:720-1235(-)
MASSSQGHMMLMKELKNLNKNPVEGFSAGLVDDANPFEWEICIIGPPDSPYEGGFFNATMKFPPTYPNHPPTLRINSEFWHPNVYNDGPRKGEVCISILHEPGEDRYGYEQASERWLPIHSVESILISVISMLSAPNTDSPANIDAAKQLREDAEGYRKRCARIVRMSIEG